MAKKPKKVAAPKRRYVAVTRTAHARDSRRLTVRHTAGQWQSWTDACRTLASDATGPLTPGGVARMLLDRFATAARNGLSLGDALECVVPLAPKEAA